MKITASPEGRENIYVPERESLIAWIEAQGFEQIHNFIAPQGGLMIGADHDPKGVVNDIRKADRLALTTGDEWKNNMKHALSIIKGNELQVYDIGELTEADFVLEGQTYE